MTENKYMDILKMRKTNSLEIEDFWQFCSNIFIGQNQSEVCGGIFVEMRFQHAKSLNPALYRVLRSSVQSQRYSNKMMVTFFRTTN